MSTTESNPLENRPYQTSLVSLIDQSCLIFKNSGQKGLEQSGPVTMEIGINNGKFRIITDIEEKESGGSNQTYRRFTYVLERNGQTIEMTELGGTLSEVRLNGRPVEPTGMFAEQLNGIVAYMDKAVQDENQRVLESMQAHVDNSEEEFRNAFRALLT